MCDWVSESGTHGEGKERIFGAGGFTVYREMRILVRWACEKEENKASSQAAIAQQWLVIDSRV